MQDTDRLVLHLLAEDRDVFRRMLTTPLAFSNVKSSTNKQTRQEELQRAAVPNAHNQRGQAPLESLYGLAEWTPQQPFEQQGRIGILMQPSWLLAWSENFNNDIVRRGRFIRERLLGGTVPDLPIGVAAMIPNEKTRTLRDVMRPVPLVTTGLVAFTGDPNLDGPVKSPHELIQRIAASDRARQVWIRHVFRYYLGRNETLADAATLQAADKAYVGSDGSFKSLLVSLLTSDSFLKRAR